MKLIKTIKIPINAYQRNSVERIDREDFSLVKIKAKKQLILEKKPHDAATLEKGILALKQYYAVAVFDAKNPHAVSDEVDPYWHAHILDTKRYAKFCEEAIGYFMHHQPNNPNNIKEMDFLERAYQYTVEVYGKIYSYFDTDMMPLEMNPENLICFHFGNSAPSKTAIFDLHPDMEPVTKHLIEHAEAV